MKRTVIGVVIALWAGVAPAQTKLTLHEALTRALEVNDTVEISRVEIGFAEEMQRGLFSAVMPRINLNGALTRNSIEQKFGEGDDGFTILPRNDWNYALVLSQLDDPYGLPETRELADATADVVECRREERLDEPGL